MNEYPLHRIEIAKKRLRKKLSFEHVTAIPKFKDLTQEEYEALIDKIEALSLLLLDSYFTQNHIQNDCDQEAT